MTKASEYKALITADWQLCNTLPHSKPAVEASRPGITNRLIDQLNVVEQIKRVAEKEKVDAVFFLGDLFEKSLLDAITLRHGVAAVVGLSRVCRVYILPGNHDAHGSTGTRFTPEVFDEIGADIQFLDGSESFGPLNAGVVFHPLAWAPMDESRKRLKILESRRAKGKLDVLLFHHSVVGSKHQGWVCDEGFEPSELTKGWDLTLGGHFHDPQELYVGAPMQHDFRDAGSPARGVWVYTFTKKKGKRIAKEFHEVKAPRFHVWDWTDAESMDETLETLTPGDYVRLNVTATHAEWTALTKEVEEFAEKWRTKGIVVLPLHKPVYHHEQRLDTDGGTVSPEEAVSKYLDAANTVGLSYDRLSEVGLAALKEVDRG